jgi:hypothetical protein
VDDAGAVANSAGSSASGEGSAFPGDGAGVGGRTTGTRSVLSVESLVDSFEPSSAARYLPHLLSGTVPEAGGRSACPIGA